MWKKFYNICIKFLMNFEIGAQRIWLILIFLSSLQSCTPTIKNSVFFTVMSPPPESSTKMSCKIFRSITNPRIWNTLRMKKIFSICLKLIWILFNSVEFFWVSLNSYEFDQIMVNFLESFWIPLSVLGFFHILLNPPEFFWSFQKSFEFF